MARFVTKTGVSHEFRVGVKDRRVISPECEPLSSIGNKDD